MWMVSTKLTMVVRYRTRIQWKSIFCSHNIHPSFIHPSWCTGGCWFNLACVGIKLWWLREREREGPCTWIVAEWQGQPFAWCMMQNKIPLLFFFASFLLSLFFFFFFFPSIYVFIYLFIYLFLYFPLYIFLFFCFGVISTPLLVCQC